MFSRRNCSRLISAVSLLGALVGLLAPGSGYALNGNTYTMICSCVTSSDFINSAVSKVVALNQAGTTTFAVVSSSGPATASIEVKAHTVFTRSPPYHALFIDSAVPVDSSGNSLAGESESQLEAYFGSYDQVFIGTSRSNPLEVTESTYYAITFINTEDTEVGPGIDQALITQQLVNWNTLPIGAIVTVTFSDGTKALYVKFQPQYSDHWAWTGVAWDKNGNRINRAGQPVSNPNTSGSGGGSVSAPGFGATGGRYNWLIIGNPLCTQNLTVVNPDGSQTDLGTIFFNCP